MSSYKMMAVSLIPLPPEPPENLPFLLDDFSLALHLGIRCKTLWYCVRRKRKLYTEFTIPKSSGKPRIIHNPQRILKFVQRRVYQRILKPLPLGEHVGAYVEGRKCRDTAEQHVGKGVRIGMDLKDFFPSHSRARVRAFFMSLGYSRYVSGLLADICTVEIKDKREDKRGKHVVPQGSPASPALCNLMAQRLLDQRILDTLVPLGWTYTRYSDDISLSHPDDLSREVVDQVIATMRDLIQRAGYRTNPKKTKVQRRWRRQKMLGMVVNEKISIPREVYRRYRSLLHNCVHHGFEPNAVRFGWDPVETFASHLQGKLSYFHSVDPVRTARLKALYDAAVAKHQGVVDELSSQPSDA